MKAVLLEKFGGPENLRVAIVKEPICAANEVLIKVHATAMNRADTLQRQGKYPVPEGASKIMGLECAGEIQKLGELVTNFKIGDKVMALLTGGGHAEFVNVNADLCMPVPDTLSFVEAAAIPEVFLTAYQALFLIGQLKQKETVLIHAGASGVGTAAIQLAKTQDAYIFTTASKTKHSVCKALGADVIIDYKKENFEHIISSKNRSVDLLVDFMGASYFQQNLNCMNLDGRMIMLGFLGGIKTKDIFLGNILSKRIQLFGTTLRSRSVAYKIDLVRKFSAHFLPLMAQKKIVPVIDSVLSIEQIIDAHTKMEENKNIGKIILQF